MAGRGDPARGDAGGGTWLALKMGRPVQVVNEIVLGKKQTSLPVALIQATQKLGERLEWCPVETSGDNAADFVLRAVRDPQNRSSQPE